MFRPYKMTEEPLNNDPDYKDFYASTKNDPNLVRAADSKDLTVSKIKTIVDKQFSLELEFKEQEIQKVEQRINTTKSMLDRLRAYVAAGYFGSGGLVVPGSKAISKIVLTKNLSSGSTQKILLYNLVFPRGLLQANNCSQHMLSHSPILSGATRLGIISTPIIPSSMVVSIHIW